MVVIGTLLLGLWRAVVNRTSLALAPFLVITVVSASILVSNTTRSMMQALPGAVFIVLALSPESVHSKVLAMLPVAGYFFQLIVIRDPEARVAENIFVYAPLFAAVAIGEVLLLQRLARSSEFPFRIVRSDRRDSSGPSKI